MYHTEVARAGPDSNSADRASSKHFKAKTSMEAADIAYRAVVVQVNAQ